MATVNKKKIVCNEYIKIGGFEVRYVQPDPLPQHIEWLQSLRLEGLKFVKIPVSDKEDKLYYASAISQLFQQTGFHWEITERLIKEYNAPDPVPTAPAPGAPAAIPNAAVDSCGHHNKQRARASLLALVQLTKHTAEIRGFEFLTE